MDDAVVRAHSKTGKRMAMVGVVTLGFGMVLGFVWGGQSEQGKQTSIAMNGARDLIGEIEKAQGKIKELSEKIDAAQKDLQAKKFPESFAADLGGLSIPFGADKLYGKGIGRFNDRALKLLFAYTQDVESLNDRKDALKNLFAGQKKAISDALGAATNPKVSWSVFVQKSPAHGPLAILAPIAATDAFEYKKADWPSKFKVQNGREAVDTTRYDHGDPTSTDNKVVTLPLDPDSVASAFPNDITARMISELVKTGQVLKGKAGNGGDEDESAGVIKNGDTLLIELKKIGSK
jgi:hypothetical protein